jgi:2-polyprenyl-6-methoxyphenol hydroxylase-like FAD-dependent oxidoreductase
MSKTKRFVIAGGGISGLTLAIALQRKGLQITFYEHAPVSEILQHTTNEQLILGDIIDLKPLDRFAVNNIVLMGDAAHATSSTWGKVPAWPLRTQPSLPICLSDNQEPVKAFQNFETLRLEIAQVEDPILMWLRNAAVRTTPLRVMEKQMKFLYDVSFQ